MKPPGDEKYLSVTVTLLSSGRSCFSLSLLVPREKEAFLDLHFSSGGGEKTPFVSKRIYLQNLLLLGKETERM